MKFSEKLECRLSGKHKANLGMMDFYGKKIADIGCSSGIFEKLASRKAKEIFAIEPEEKSLKIAKKEAAAKNVRFLKGSALDLSALPKRYFDAAVMFDVIEHIPKKSELKALEEIKSILKKRGMLLISTPADNISKFFDPAWYFGHRHYGKIKMAAILNKAGFRIEKVYVRGGFFELLNMFLFYIFKWIFNSEVPFKNWLDKKRDNEYLSKKEGFVTLFIVAHLR